MTDKKSLTIQEFLEIAKEHLQDIESWLPEELDLTPEELLQALEKLEKEQKDGQS